MNALRILLVCCAVAAAAEHPEVLLWPNGAPNSQGKAAKEVVEAPNQEHGYLKVTEVHRPSVTVYLPEPGKSTGAAMIIAPGGGHRFLNFDQEGTYVAEYLNSIGVAGFVLKYRLAREPGSTYQIERDAMADAQQAIRVVRAEAAKWGVRRDRVGIMGFSAGGEVAALAGTKFDAETRPDFVALIYPGIQADRYTIPAGMPPVFMLCADNDAGPSAALAGLYPKLKAAKVQTEVHVYAAGGHGFGINPKTKNTAPVATSWQMRLGDWLKTILATDERR